METMDRFVMSNLSIVAKAILFINLHARKAFKCINVVFLCGVCMLHVPVFESNIKLLLHKQGLINLRHLVYCKLGGLNNI